MKSNSRTAKSIKNSVVAMSFYIVNLALQFFSRKVFLDYLGTEILGLNTTAMNLLQFLNLAELGVNAAVGFTLYKPLHDNDIQSVNEIVTLQGRLYRRIAMIIIGGAAVLMCFFPLIFAKIELPLWYAYASFGVLLYSALLGYFVNYRQIVLTASQQDYKVLYSYKSVMILKVLFQMCAVRYFDNAYVWWLVLEVVFASVASLSLHRMTMKAFPALADTGHSFRQLCKKYPEFILKIKQLFIHKFGGFAIYQVSPLIIYAYTSLSLVAVYGNYMIIVTGIQIMAQMAFAGMTAGIGNLIAEGNKEKIVKVFEEYFSLRFFISAVMTFGLFVLSTPLVTLWIGPNYLLPQSTLLIILAIMYITLFRHILESFISAYGLYSDVYATVVEASVNITLSVILGAFYGLDGVLGGTLVSILLVVVFWKPYYLFRKGFNGHYDWFVRMFIMHNAIGIGLAFVFVFSTKVLFHVSTQSVTHAFFIGLAVVALYAVVLCALLYVFTNGMRMAAGRISSLLRSTKS